MSFWDDNQPPSGGSLGGGVTSLPGIAAGPGGAPPGATNGTTAPGQASGLSGVTTHPNYGNLSDPSQWMNLVGNDATLTQWVQQQNPGLSPDLVQYYVGKIKGQPGANPTEQAGSANYWMQKLQADPTTGGGGGARGISSSNPNGIPGLDPGYDFQVGEATKAIQRSAASKGTLLTGGTLKGLADYVGNDMASSAYQGAFNRSYNLASLGENAAANQGNNNTSYATGATNALTNNANAQGNASIATGNAISGGINNAISGYTLNNLFKPKLTSYGGGGLGDVGPVQ